MPGGSKRASSGKDGSRPKRRKGEPEAAFRARILGWASSQFGRRVYGGVGSSQSAPLQVRTYKWENPDKSAIAVDTGSIWIVNTLDAGNGDDQRHTHKTIIYKMLFQGTMWVNDATSAVCGPLTVHFWLVYDAAPKGVLPALTDIFEEGFSGLGSTWVVNRDNVHRFVVKRRWQMRLMTNGQKPYYTNRSGNGDPTSVTIRDFRKFFTKLRTATEWKNSATGGIGDIKKGALYLCAMCSQAPEGSARAINLGVKFRGQSRIYFKCTGNQ
uniref:Capsid protein n=1 Tax=Rice latent virus 1 TaxID=2012856 RepID=A0A2D0WZ75_9GEMI|nr:capsid protein [Rice latent virus 1]